MPDPSMTEKRLEMGISNASRLRLGLVLAPLLLTHCAGSERQITLLTPFAVLPPSADILKGLRNPSANLSQAIIGTPSSITEPIELPAGISPNEYCLQTDIRISYLDQRPGFPPLFGRVNLITKRDNTTWNLPATGAIGLTNAMGLIGDGSKSFLMSPLVMNLPKDARGIIRIQGSLVKPISAGVSQNQRNCPKFDASQAPAVVPAPAFTLWGEAPLNLGGPTSIALPINVVTTQPRYTIPSTPVSTPYPIPAIDLATGSLSNPSTPGLQCRNLSNKASCPNRNLMEFKVAEYFFNSNYFSITYGPVNSEGAIQVMLRNYVNDPSPFYQYVPKNPLFDISYIDTLTLPKKTRIDWAQKRYSFEDPFPSLTQRDYPMQNCSNGSWGIRLPGMSQSQQATLQVGSCSLGWGSNDPNLIITDLGEGFY